MPSPRAAGLAQPVLPAACGRPGLRQHVPVPAVWAMIRLILADGIAVVGLQWHGITVSHGRQAR